MQWLKIQENPQYDENIPHKPQKCKGIQSTVQAEIIEMDSFKKVLGDYSGLIDMFVYFYDEEARSAFFAYTTLSKQNY